MEGGGKRIKRAPSAILRLIRESKDLAVWLLTTKVKRYKILELAAMSQEIFEFYQKTKLLRLAPLGHLPFIDQWDRLWWSILLDNEQAANDLLNISIACRDKDMFNALLADPRVDPTNCLEEIATWKYGTAVFLMDARLSEEQRHALLTKHTEHEKKVARLRQLYHTDPAKGIREF